MPDPISTATIDRPVIGRPPAVLQVLPALVTGGVERGTVDVAKALVQAGWKAYVASEGGVMVRELERAGAEHFTLPLASKNPFTIRRNAEKLEELIRRLPVDLVHARSRAPAWSALMAAQATGKPFVTTFHNAYKAHNWFKRRWASAMGRGDKVIAISDFVAGHAHQQFGVPLARLITIPRGIDTARFDPAKVSPERMTQMARAWRLVDGLPVILLPGRLTRWKGHRVLIEALRLLKEKQGRADFVAVLAGDNQGRIDYQRELETQIDQAGLAGAMRLPGPCRDMAAGMMLADVVVSASIEPEGFGRVAVEAQAMGKPVIATDHGGARETVLSGETGWLVPPNDPEALAWALEAALALTPQKRLEIGAASRQHAVAHFTVETMCQATLQVYTDLLFPAAAQPAPMAMQPGNAA